MAPSATSPAPVAGIHHITAVAATAMENRLFYSHLLGLRLVKKTVNFDDPFTYHLYYGSETGQPGTILTFFPWEHARTGKPGAGMITAVAFSVPAATMQAWSRHLTDHGIEFETHIRFGEPVIAFTDPHGLGLELVGRPTVDRSSVPPGNAPPINGFHSATLLVNRFPATRQVIADIMHMAPAGQEGTRHRFAMQDPTAPGHLLDVVADPGAPAGIAGAGTVHHIAFRTSDSQMQLAWQRHLRANGLAVTDVRDRKYFKSIYFSEPGGILFEIATDPPGFAIDEAPHELGSELQLPAQYENLRRTIEDRLPPLSVPKRRTG